MLNTSRHVYFLIILSTANIFALDICYAANINIPCSSSPETASWIYYVPSTSKSQLSLTTIGIKIRTEGETPLGIRAWHDRSEKTNVIAQCASSPFPMDMFTNIDDILQLPYDDKDKYVPTLTCGPGEKIAIKMSSPNSDHPTDYTYVGELTEYSEEDDTFPTKTIDETLLHSWVDLKPSFDASGAASAAPFLF